MKPYFFFTVTKKDDHLDYLSYQNSFILVLCNNINEFLTHCPVEEALNRNN